MMKRIELNSTFFFLTVLIFFNAIIAVILNKFGFFPALVLCTVVTTAFFIIRKPVIGLYIAVIIELWFAGYYIFDIYYLRLRLIILPFITIIVFLKLILRGDEVKLSEKSRQAIFISILFLLWAFCLSTLIYKEDINALITPMARIGGGILVSTLIALLITDLEKLRNYLYAMFFAASLSALIGILQIFVGEPFYSIRKIFVSADFPITYMQSGRAAGLTFYYIPFSYQMLSVLLVSSIILAVTKFTSMKERLFIIFVNVILFTGLLLSYTRSAMFAFCIALIFMSWRNVGKRSVMVYSVIMISFVIITITTITLPGASHRMARLGDASSTARIPLAKMSYVIASQNPLGVGPGRFQEYADKYYRAVSGLRGSTIVLRTSSHNHLLNTLIYYGIPGFLLTIYFYIKVFQAVPKGIGKVDPLLNLLGKNLPCIFIGYLIHSSFHNAGPFVGDNFIWYVIGIVFALDNIAERERIKETA